MLMRCPQRTQTSGPRGRPAGLAVLLATLGIYGVMSYPVSQRTNEFGVRLAAGAPPSRVSGMVVLQGARLAQVGTVGGLAGALAFAGVLRSLLFGVEPVDAATLAAVGVLTLCVCLVACWLPARRAPGWTRSWHSGTSELSSGC
jgi:ABC-type antimicrobial peptide transport system permease subunit